MASMNSLELSDKALRRSDLESAEFTTSPSDHPQTNHTTTSEAATAIPSGGFQDGRGTYT